MKGKIKMFTISERPRSFLVFTIVQMIFACLILVNEIASIYSRVPGGNYPIEHKGSWVRVLLFFGVALVSFVFARRLIAQKKPVVTPSLVFVLILATLLTFFSIFLYYFAYMGWCCEQPYGYFFGFPFSFVRHIAGFDYSLIPTYADYGFFEILASSKLLTSWIFDPYPFILNLLFWSNSTFVFLIMVPLRIRTSTASLRRSTQDDGNS